MAGRKKTKQLLDEQEVYTFVRNTLNDKDLVPDLEEISKQSGVHVSTLYAWIEGRINSPYHINLNRVLNTLGFELEWQTQATIKPKKRGKKNHGGTQRA